jgi:predicted nucleic acid-binding Zn ribbon protein
MSGSPPQRARAALAGLLEGLEFGGRIRENLAIAYWPMAVGPVVAGKSRAEEVRNGVLVVRTAGSTWSQEISLLKYRILPELNRLCGAAVIKDLCFRAIGVPTDTSQDKTDTPTEEELKRVVLGDDEQACLQADLEQATGIPDQDIREAVVGLTSRGYRLRRWRLQHGWVQCPDCRGLFPGADAACTVCLAAG